MKLEDRSTWAFHLNDVYMDVLLLRDTSEINPELSGTYSIDISVHSKNENQCLALAGDKRKNWCELYPDIRNKQDQIRVDVEKNYNF